MEKVADNGKYRWRQVVTHQKKEDFTEKFMIDVEEFSISSQNTV